MVIQDLEGLGGGRKVCRGLIKQICSAINMEAELVTAKDRTKIAL